MSTNGGYSRVDMSAIAPLMPANKTAALTASKGEHFEWAASHCTLHSSAPIPHRTPNREELIKPSFKNLTGMKFGRLSVLGIAAEIPSKAKGQRWVVRCVCGAHEIRKAKAIKAAASGRNGEDNSQMCAWCANNQRLQRGLHNQKKASHVARTIRGEA
jgi:hypothetical protein